MREGRTNHVGVPDRVIVVEEQIISVCIKYLQQTIEGISEKSNECECAEIDTLTHTNIALNITVDCGEK